MKGLTTPLSRWLRGSCLFVQVLGDLRVVSYWIDTLVLKNGGKYLRYSRGKPTQAQDVAIRISGAGAKSQDTKYPSQSLSLALHYLPFASHFPLPPIHPCRFIRPLSLSILPLFLYLPLFTRSSFACVLD